MVRVGIIGGAGYTGGEAIRILLNHPEAELVFVHSNSNAGNRLCDVHVDLLGETDMRFTGELRTDVDALLLCVGHGDARKFLEATPLPDSVRVIDLSQDFRLSASSSIGGRRFVYGLPEMNRELAKGKKLIANPGCYPSSAILGLYAAFKHGLISPDNIVIDSKSGTSGAGRKPVVPSLFCEVYDTFRAYGLGKHRHTPEIEQEYSRAAGCDVRVSFNPHLVPMVRGILSTIYTTLRKPGTTLDEVHAAYCETWAQSPWVRVLPKGKLPETRFVRGSMFCDLGLVVDPRTNRLIVVSAIDNLCRGASGQALANANLMCGLPVDCGLNAAPMLP